MTSLQTLRRWSIRFIVALVAAAAVFTTVVAVDGWTAFGAKAAGERRDRMQRSPQWNDRGFDNPQPLHNDMVRSIVRSLRPNPYGRPSSPVPVESVDRHHFAPSPPSGLRVMWFGHSTLVVELDGYRILTDPVWGPRTSAVTWLGPERWYAPPLALDQLPPIDAVLLSHNHYDHLDHPTIVALRDRPIPFIAPLGVGAHLQLWGVPADRSLVARSPGEHRPARPHRRDSTRPRPYTPRTRHANHPV